MRILINFVIIMQLISASFAHDLGEQKPFAPKRHLLSTISATEARAFEETLRSQIDLTTKNGFVYKGTTYRPSFKETSPGSWSYLAQGNKISFTGLDIFQGQIYINDKALTFKGMPLEELEQKAEKLLIKKTSLLRRIYLNSIGIQEAEACELICGAVVVVLAAAIIGTAVYQLMVKPEKVVKRLNEMKDKLDKDASTCEESRNDRDKYEKTFSLANSISDRSAIGSVTSTSEAIEYAMKKQLEIGDRKNEDCFKIMNEVGKKLDINIPVPSDRQIQMRELMGAKLQNEKVDVANSAFNLCQSYNRLGSCMDKFVAAHVNDSDISTFKETAEPSHWRYQKRMQGSQQ